jgi:hypothetical protein
VPHLREAEIDRVMAGSDDDEFNVEALPEHRWRSSCTARGLATSNSNGVASMCLT